MADFDDFLLNIRLTSFDITMSLQILPNLLMLLLNVKQTLKNLSGLALTKK